MEIERNARKEAAAEKKKLTQFRSLCDTLKNRGIKFDDIRKNKPITVELLRPKFLPLEDFPVHLDEGDTTLIWPTVFSYPEFLFSDFVQQLSEAVV